MIADMHCHVDLYPDYAGVAEEASRQEIWVLAVTTTPKAWQGTCERLNIFPNIHVAIGLHPELAHTRAQELPMLERFVHGTAFVGEVGLDGSPAYREYAAIQQEVFKQILHVCQEAGGKVLSIHSRRAAAEVLTCLEKRRECGIPILHWFTGSKAELEAAKRLDCWFSVGPPLLQTPAGIQRVNSMPRERVLLETDGPFGKVNDQVLRPTAVRQAIGMLAQIWRVPQEDAESQIEDNQRAIWRFAGVENR
jgi:TatD DNase family protein